MELKGNTILITGGGSGIGRGLAEQFMKEGSTVIIAGRNKEKLDAATAANPGMKSAVLDIDNAESIRNFAAQITKDFPALNAVIHNAGAMRMEDVKQPNSADADAIITTNLLGPIRLNSALMPHLLKQPKATVLTVSSGLAFVPLATTPTYCATKAALHSYTQSLRFQLRETNISVIEIIPPYVQTELTGPQQAADPRAMPLADYIDATMKILRESPEENEILVEQVKPLRYAMEGGDFLNFFTKFNEAMASHE